MKLHTVIVNSNLRSVEDGAVDREHGSDGEDLLAALVPAPGN